VLFSDVLTPDKLKLKLETVRTLKQSELPQIVGGAATDHCAHPTTTVLHTFDC